MLWSASNFLGYAVEATDGMVGEVDDLLFDDRAWTVRWAVIDTGTWLPGREVLLPPTLLTADVAGQRFAVDLTRPQVEAAPAAELDEPVSRQMELRLYAHYRLAPYWAAIAGAAPGGALEGLAHEGDPHLRSVDEVTGYYVHATDGNIGHIEDFLVDPDAGGWALRYVVVDTRNWWPGRTVLLAPPWLSAIDWNGHAVRVGMTREAVRSGPDYDPSVTVDRAYEERLHRHYGFPAYWT